jgi:hypothetical protein
LAKVGFDLIRVPDRHDRVSRFWDQEDGGNSASNSKPN